MSATTHGPVPPGYIKLPEGAIIPKIGAVFWSSRHSEWSPSSLGGREYTKPYAVDNVHVPSSVPIEYPHPPVPEGFTIVPIEQVKRGSKYVYWYPHRQPDAWSAPAIAAHDFVPNAFTVPLYAVAKKQDEPTTVPAGYRTLRSDEERHEETGFRVFSDGQWNSEDHSKYLSHTHDRDRVAVPLDYQTPAHYRFAELGDTTDELSLYWSADSRRWKCVATPREVEARHVNRRCYAVLKTPVYVPGGYRLVAAGFPLPGAWLELASESPHKWVSVFGAPGRRVDYVVAVPITPLPPGYRICLPGEVLGRHSLILGGGLWHPASDHAGQQNHVFPNFAAPITAPAPEPASTPKDDPELPFGCVRIKRGEKVRKGLDKWLNTSGKWIPAPCSFRKYDGTGWFARPVEPSEWLDAAGEINPKWLEANASTPAPKGPPTGYVSVKAGEVIPKGALWYCYTNQWLPAAAIGSKADNGSSWCRPEATFPAPPSRPWRAADVVIGARVFRRALPHGDSNPATILAVKDDGVLFENNLTVAAGEIKMPLKEGGQEGLWYSFEALANNGFLLADSQSPCRVAEQWHNPRNLTAEQVGIADGWRLLLKSETDAGKFGSGDEFWRISTGRFEHAGLPPGGCYRSGSDTVRTKQPLPTT